MPPDDLIELVRRSLADFDRCDGMLLACQTSERSITHKLAEHLRRHVDLRLGQKADGPVKIAVDCEYNSFGFDGDTKRLYWTDALPPEDEASEFTPNPDIVVHERGPQDNNWLVIEVKTYFHCADMHVLLDLMKLVGFLKEPTRYEHGLFLNLGFNNGVVVDDARLIVRGKMEQGDATRQNELRRIGRDMLLTPVKGKPKPTQQKLNAETNGAAKDFIPLFRDAFGFDDIRDHLSLRK